MSYELTYDEERNLIMGQVHGELNVELVGNMSSDLAGMVRKHNCYKFVNDLRNAKIKLSTFEIYSIPRTFVTQRDIARCKRALVVQNPLGDYNFLETVSVNVSQQVKIFTDMDSAIDWLNSLR